MKFSAHAQSRMSQRRINRSAVSLVLTYGRVIHCTGASFHFLGERDLPGHLVREHQRLIGTTVVISRDGEVITVYKNRDAISTIKRKKKRYEGELPPLFSLWLLYISLSRARLCAKTPEGSS